MSRIETLATYFASPHGPVTAVTFARQHLATAQRTISRQLGRGEIVAQQAIMVLSVALPETSAVADAPLAAYVNHGNWLVRCECGGCEGVDAELLVTMCCSCWNREQGHRWRPVVMPQERDEIERLLLVRPAELRNWHPGETAADLARENAEHGIGVAP